jgi:hypothetical protein
MVVGEKRAKNAAASPVSKRDVHEEKSGGDCARRVIGEPWRWLLSRAVIPECAGNDGAVRIQAEEKAPDACSRDASRFVSNALSPIPSLFDKGIVDTVAAHASCCSNQFRVGATCTVRQSPARGFRQPVCR